jgi:hypothetical protein
MVTRNIVGKKRSVFLRRVVILGYFETSQENFKSQANGVFSLLILHTLQMT